MNVKLLSLCFLVLVCSATLAADPIPNQPSAEQILLGIQAGCQDNSIKSLTDKSQQNIKAAVTECRCISDYVQPTLVEIRESTPPQSIADKVQILVNKTAEARSFCKTKSSDDAAWTPNLSGEWISKTNPTCPEQISYLPNNQFALKNNEEVITGRYTLATQYTEGGRLRIEYFMQKSNEKADCQGGKTLQVSLDQDHAAPNSGYLIVNQKSTIYLNFDIASGKPQSTLGPYYRVK